MVTDGDSPITILRSLDENRLFTDPDVVVVLPMATVFPSSTYKLPVIGRVGYFIESLSIVVALSDKYTVLSVNAVSAEFSEYANVKTATQW